MDLRPRTENSLMEMFHLLFDHFGPQNWWPADTEFEVMIGAVLTQNTSWKNVEKALDNLKGEGGLSLRRIDAMRVEDLALLIRPAGYFNVKARRLKNLIRFVAEEYEGDLGLFLGEETDVLRRGLLSVKGIGPETADSILLYAARRPIFVVDAYTHRILHRHEMIDETVSYEEIQDLFMGRLPEDERLFNEFHALIVQTGKEFCKRKPKCEVCPLREWVSPPQAAARAWGQPSSVA